MPPRRKTNAKSNSTTVLSKRTRKNTSVSIDDVISISSTDINSETTSVDLSEKPNSSSEILSTIRKRMIGHGWNVPTLTEHLCEHQKTLVDLMSRCLEWKESNSILIEGPVGSGKRSLVRNAVMEFKNMTSSSKSHSKGHSKKGNLIKCPMKFVHLNGLIVSDVKTCLKEISRQLFRSASSSSGGRITCPSVGDDIEMRSDEEEEEEEENVDPEAQKMSVSNSLAFVLQTLQSNRNENESSSSKGETGLVFVLECFEHFVQSKSQMLLYNLFDTCQSYRTPLLVIGVSNRLDVSELLEKRVKSRFSHRSISLWNDLSFDQWMSCAQELLCVDEPPTKNSRKKIPPSPERIWNEFIGKLLQTEKCIVHLERLHLSFPTVTSLKHVLLRFIIRLQPLIAEDNSNGLEEYQNIFESCVVDLISGAHSKLNLNLSHCELVMISAMKKIVERDELEWVTFGMVYQEYCSFARRNQSHRKIERSLAMNCLENLVEMKVIHTSDNRTNNRSMLKCYRKYKLLLDLFQLNDVIRTHAYCPSNVKMWALGLSDQ